MVAIGRLDMEVDTGDQSRQQSEPSRPYSVVALVVVAAVVILIGNIVVVVVVVVAAKSWEVDRVSSIAA
jgi:hypothetical protein